MAFSLNRVTLIGNAGKDPEIRSTQDGREVASFTLATSEAWKDKATGEKRERTEWHKVVIFSQPIISIIKNYVHKGSKLYVEGALHSRKWTDQSNVERSVTEVVIQSYHGTIMILEGRHGVQKSDMKEPHTMDEKGSNSFDIETLDDEIPF
ncbi:MAG: single-stranded DNA-binding protein [Alphaproteobacteria bacterium]|jgi:single-strand DNA-binding protein|nr:single-stranded DNA-binding protein [Candidatus Jidaibacter sp.]